MPGFSRGILFLTAILLVGCGDAPAGASGNGGAGAATTAAPDIAPGPADGDMLDVCGLVPKPALQAALGELTETVDANRRQVGGAGIQTEPGYGACSFSGPGWETVRVDVSTAFASVRAGLGTPRNYVEKIWPFGQGPVETLDGPGVAALLSQTGEDDFVIAAASEDRYVQVIASSIPRDRVLALTRAIIEMPLTR